MALTLLNSILLVSKIILTVDILSSFLTKQITFCPYKFLFILIKDLTQILHGGIRILLKIL